MGMTIDVAKVNLCAIQVYYNDDMQDSYVGFDKEDNESVDIAIETMRKYQKIEEAYKKYQNDMVTNIYADKKFVKALEGIFEDGKTN